MRGGVPKLTPEQRAEIAWRGKSELVSSLAKEYGLSVGYTSKLVNRTRVQPIKSKYGQVGGLATAHTTLGQHREDLKEVDAYVSSHPGCEIADISMECNMSWSAAKRLVQELRE